MIVILLAFLTLGAPASASPAVERTSTPVTTLAGKWRVTAVDDVSVDSSLGLTLRADARRIWWEPSCAGMVRYYRLIKARVHVSGYPRNEAPTIICPLAPPREMVGVFAAIDSATKVRRTSGTSVELSGGGHSLLLFSQ